MFELNASRQRATCGRKNSRVIVVLGLTRKNRNLRFRSGFHLPAVIVSKALWKSRDAEIVQVGEPGYQLQLPAKRVEVAATLVLNITGHGTHKQSIQVMHWFHIEACKSDYLKL